MFAFLIIVKILIDLASTTYADVLGLEAFAENDLDAAKCYQILLEERLIKLCIDRTPLKYQVSKTTAPTGNLQNKTLGQLKSGTCPEHCKLIECINNGACSKCTYAQAQTFAIWYDVEGAKGDRNCNKKFRAKCQLAMSVLLTGTSTNSRIFIILLSITLGIFVVITVVMAIYCFYRKTNTEKITKPYALPGVKSKDDMKDNEIVPTFSV